MLIFPTFGYKVGSWGEYYTGGISTTSIQVSELNKANTLALYLYGENALSGGSISRPQEIADYIREQTSQKLRVQIDTQKFYDSIGSIIPKIMAEKSQDIAKFFQGDYDHLFTNSGASREFITAQDITSSKNLPPNAASKDWDFGFSFVDYLGYEHWEDGSFIYNSLGFTLDAQTKFVVYYNQDGSVRERRLEEIKYYVGDQDPQLPGTRSDDYDYETLDETNSNISKYLHGEYHDPFNIGQQFFIDFGTQPVWDQVQGSAGEEWTYNDYIINKTDAGILKSVTIDQHSSGLAYWALSGEAIAAQLSGADKPLQYHVDGHRLVLGNALDDQISVAPVETSISSIYSSNANVLIEYDGYVNNKVYYPEEYVDREFGDHIYTGFGDDQISAGKWNDQIFGGEGADTIDGGDGYDIVGAERGYNSGVVLGILGHQVEGILNTDYGVRLSSVNFLEFDGDEILNVELLELSDYDDVANIGNIAASDMNRMTIDFGIGEDTVNFYDPEGVRLLNNTIGDDRAPWDGFFTSIANLFKSDADLLVEYANEATRLADEDSQIQAAIDTALDSNEAYDDERTGLTFKSIEKFNLTDADDIVFNSLAVTPELLKLEGGAGDDILGLVGDLNHSGIKVDGGEGDDHLLVRGGADIEISGGSGEDFIYAENLSDPNNPIPLEQARKQLIIDAGSDADQVQVKGAAEIYLGDGDDALLAAGVGSVIDLGSGGSGDRDTVNMDGARGSLIIGADGYDTISMLGNVDLAGSYLKHRDSESKYTYGLGGGIKLAINANGELVVGDHLSKDGDDDSFLYLANYTNRLDATSAELTAGVRMAEWWVNTWQLLKGPGVDDQEGDQSMWDFISSTWKDLHFRSGVGGVDPLVLDLDGDGLELTSMVTGVSPMFDMDGDGFAEHTGWVAPDDGMLALDSNGNGVIDDIGELFGGAGMSGFAELALHDDNSDGIIDVNDAVYSDLRVWRDLDRDGETDDGELFSLADLNIQSISLQATDDGSTNALNVVERTGSFTYEDGTTGEVGDVTFRINNYNSVYTGDTTIAPEVSATMPGLKGHGTLADLQVSITLDGINGALAQTINAVLPTLNVVDLDVLYERATAILNAWTEAAPVTPTSGSYSDVPAFISREDGQIDVLDFAYQTSETITLPDDTTVNVTFWKTAGGTPIKDDQGQTIDYPTLEELLAHQSGVADLTWEMVSAEKFAFMERYFGEEIPINDPTGFSSTSVSGFANMLETTERVSEQLTLRLAMQGGLKDYFDGVEYSVEDDRFRPTTDFELIPFFKKVFETAPADAAGAEAWLASWKPLIDALLSDYERPGGNNINAPFIFTNVVAAYETIGLPVSLALAAEQLGISPDIVDYGSGTRTGTTDQEIFYMSTGDDVVESKSGSDVFVFGQNFGQDVINDYEASADSFDTIRFAHLTPQDIVATRDGKDLVLTDTATGDSVRVIGQFHDINYSLFGGQVGPFQGIEEIVFANGDVWGAGEIAEAVSHPLDTDDTLIGTDHFDVLDGGLGNDFLQGGNNFDVYRFDVGYGHDTILDRQMNVGSEARDVVTFGEGLTRADLSFYRDGNSNTLVINTTAGDSLTIQGQFFAATALGQEYWIDRIESFQFEVNDGESRGFDHEDIMRELVAQAKTDGDDIIYGFTFNDILDGGAGNDTLVGGNKNDTYKFGFGYGSDIFDEGGSIINVGFENTDRVLFGAGVTEADVTLERDDNGSDLTVRLSDGSSFSIARQFLGLNIDGSHIFAIETFEFEDGPVWDQEHIYNTLLQSTSGDDSLYGFWRDDILDGGAGNDYLDGGDGNDAYVFGFGYGEDVVYDGAVSVFTNDADKIQFGAGVKESDVTLERDGSSNSLLIRLSDGSTLTVQSQFFGLNTGGGHLFAIETFEFEDGTVWNQEDIYNRLLQSTSGDDTLYGFWRDDILDGGAGNDYLNGGDGNDTYVFGFGYGQDVVYDELVSIFTNDADKLLFGPGVTQADVTWSRDGGSNNLIATLSDGSQLTINSQFTYDNFGNKHYAIEQFEFDDGSTVSLQEIKDQLLQATDGDDVLYGFASEDVFDGGAGNDTYHGGEYADTYHFGYGYGHDLINDFASSAFIGGNDRIVFGDGIETSEVQVTWTGDNEVDLTLTVDTGESITISNYRSKIFGFSFNTVEEVLFADGTLWETPELMARYVEGAVSEADDSIEGFGDLGGEIRALGGNDTIFGFNGNNTYVGGTGNDHITGGYGDDTYMYALGDGNDVIVEEGGKGTDTLEFGAGILSTDIQVIRDTTNYEDITLELADGSQIKLEGQLSSSANAGVETVLFDDGTVWTADDIMQAYLQGRLTDGDNIYVGFSNDETIDGGLGNDELHGAGGADELIGGEGEDSLYGGEGTDELKGGAQNDSLYGGLEADMLTGGLGADTLDGGSGNDTYIYNLGDGNDTIYDGFNNGALDRLQLGAGILPDEVTMSISGSDRDDVTLHFVDGGSITLDEQFYSSLEYGLEEIVFADGTVWDAATLATKAIEVAGTDGDDTIYGFNDRGDQIEGGLGDDTLDGGGGDDTYIYNLGDGHDTIYEGFLGGTQDRLQLGAGILPDEVVISISGSDRDDITLHFVDGGSITLDEQFRASVDYGLEEIAFADGTVWDVATLATKAIELAGTDGDDTIFGFHDRGDHIEGGLGDDTIDGGGGNDTYIYNLGDGHDTIYDGFNSGSLDRLQLGAGILPDEVTFSVSSADADDVTLHFVDGGSITLDEQFRASVNYGLEEIVFDDGTIWDAATLAAKIIEQLQTDGDDSVTGFADRGDRIEGGLGNDQLDGSGGDDTFVYNRGDGGDTIVEGFNKGANDTLLLADLNPGDIRLRRDGNDVTVAILESSPGAGDGGWILLADSHDDYAGTGVETIEFADGTVWDRQIIRDTIATQTNSGPVLASGIASQSIDEDQSWNFQMPGSAFSDPDGDHLTYTATLDDGSALPSWLELDEMSGVFSGTPPQDFNGTLSLKVTAFDGTASVDETFDLVINPLNDAPVLANGLEDQVVGETQGWSFIVPEDAFTDPDRDTLTLSATLADGSPLPAWLSFNASTRAFFGTPPQGFLGTLSLLVIAFDGVSSTSSAFNLLIEEAPQLSFDITGTGLDETLSGTSAGETIAGLGGDDTINGGDGDDTYYYYLGDGNDVVFEGYKDGAMDRLILGVGINPDDVTIAISSSDYDDVTLHFSDGGSIKLDEQFYSGNERGVEEIEFADGTIWDKATLAAKALEQAGTDGDDTINGFDDRGDQLVGGLGNDTLYGRDGSDTYIYNLGDGNDSIFEDYKDGSLDKLVLGAGILPGEVTVSISASDYDDVTLHFVDGGSVTLNEQFRYGSEYGVEEIIFADGTVWDAAMLAANALADAKTDGDDTISGFDDRGDQVEGGLGNDSLNGRDGNDTYIYKLGDGNDTIFEDYKGGGLDKLVLGAGILPGEVTVSISASDYDDVTLHFVDGGSVTLNEQFRYGSEYGVEEIIFADGTVWDAAMLAANALADAKTDGDDTISGFDDRGDQVEGGLGNDSLNGRDGKDTYIYKLGDGNDTIFEDYKGGGLDKLVLGAGILPGEVTVSISASDYDDVTLHFVDGGSVTLNEQFRYGSEYGVEEIVFADGTVWDAAMLAANALADAKTDGDDTISGFDDRGDQVEGGLGNDSLNGRDGNDTYIYNLGDGNDTIFEDYKGGGLDKLVLGAGITAADVTVVRSSSDTDDVALIFADGGTIHLNEQLNSWSEYGLEAIEFADGTTWNDADLITQSQASTSGGTALVGDQGANTISGGVGVDFLFGLAGDDVINGADGDDQILGGAGNDTFVFSLSAGGHDTIGDFSAGAATDDLIEFGTGQFVDFASVIAAASDDGVDTTITVGAATSIVLQSVLVADLHQDDFQFV